MTRARIVLSPLLAASVSFAGSAAAQQLYRWTDDQGRVHVTDSPPPSGAKNVQARKADAPPSASADAGTGGSLPFELQKAMKDFPVVLYSAPTCEELCSLARAALNKRGIPFQEIVVRDDKGNAELKKVSGSNVVPVILVGSRVQQGFQAEALDTLLDYAGYPKAGTVPPRSQQAPKPPAAKEASKPVEEASTSRGRYSPVAPSLPDAEPQRRYAPIPGKDEPLTGPYGAKSTPPASDAPEK
ncbi:MAG: glutaredoxin family protein [Betaproteobacteria bacterium]|nr:glutaredoxin family protein [Betaproteobacteria bacterium]